MKIKNKNWIRLTTSIVIISLLYQNILLAQDKHLAPKSNKKDEMRAVMICETIEKRARYGRPIGRIYLDDILKWAKPSEEEFSGCRFEILPHEIRIHLPSSNIIVRYFDPSKADSISGFKIKIIGPRLHRQIIQAVKGRIRTKSQTALFTMLNGVLRDFMSVVNASLAAVVLRHYPLKDASFAERLYDVIQRSSGLSSLEKLQEFNRLYPDDLIDNISALAAEANELKKTLSSEVGISSTGQKLLELFQHDLAFTISVDNPGYIKEVMGSNPSLLNAQGLLVDTLGNTGEADYDKFSHIDKVLGAYPDVKNVFLMFDAASEIRQARKIADRLKLQGKRVHVIGVVYPMSSTTARKALKTALRQAGYSGSIDLDTLNIPDQSFDSLSKTLVDAGADIVLSGLSGDLSQVVELYARGRDKTEMSPLDVGNLVKKMDNDSGYPTYVVSDPLFRILNLGRNANAMSVPSETSDSLTHWKVQELLRIAERMNLVKGVSALCKLIEDGNVIFLKASKFSPRSYSEDLDEETRGRIERRASTRIKTTIFHERLHFTIERLEQTDSESLGRILHELMESNDRYVKATIQWAGLCGIGETTFDIEVLCLVLDGLHTPKRADMVIKRIFSADIYEKVKALWLATPRPTKQQVEEARDLANELAPYNNIPDFYDIVNKRFEGDSARRDVPKYGNKDYWLGGMGITRQDLVNLGLVHDFGTELKLSHDAFPLFTDMPKEVKDLVLQRLTHPYSTHKDILKEREPVEALLTAVNNEKLDRIIDLINSYSELKDKYYKELRRLRSYHYPHKYYKKVIGRFSEPYPEVSQALIYLGQIIVLLSELYKILPESDSPVVQRWKKRIKDTLSHPELEPFIKRNVFLRHVSNIDNPYVFLKRDELDDIYPRTTDWEEGAKIGEARAIQEQLGSAELEALKKEFFGLAGELSGLWELHVPTANKMKKGNKGDRHPFLRQFPDGIMKDPLANIVFYSRISQLVLKNGYRFADINQPRGTVRLTSYKNPLIKEKVGRVEVVPVSINLGGDKNALLLSGPNMGGKTTTARGIGAAVLLTQIGMPIPGGNHELAVFRNIYTIFPRPEQLQSGYGYFGTLVKELTELCKKAGEGDLVILDEVPTGTDYKELVAIATVLVEDLIKSGATVIVTGHLKKSFELLAERTGQQPYMHTVKENDGQAEPDFNLVPGIAKHSYAIELTKKAGFPSEITDLSRLYYRIITEGVDAGVIPAPEPIEKSGEEEKDKIDAAGMVEVVLSNLYPFENFVFPKTQKRMINKFMNSVLEELQDAVEGKIKPEKDYGEQRFKTTAVFLSQGINYLNKLAKFLSVFTELLKEEDRWVQPRYNHSVNMKKIGLVEGTIKILLSHLEALKEDPQINEVISSLGNALIKLNELREEYKDKDVKGLDKAALDKLNTQWMMSWTNLIKGDGKLLQLLELIDEYNGIAKGIIKHKLKASRFSDSSGVFSLKNSKPLFPNEFPSSNPFIERAVEQSFQIDPSKPILVLTGPNSSGKTVLMFNSYMNALMAKRGFYVSGDLEMSRFNNVFAFFGGMNDVTSGESYFLNILNRYAEIIRKVTPDSLVILDELHGTDNFELAAIQLAVLHYLRRLNVIVIFNTHIRDGLKIAADRVGFDIWKTDVEYYPKDQRVKPKFTVSPDPGLTAKSYGLAVAEQWLSSDQVRRAREILSLLDPEDPNISYGTICESGHEGSYNALDEQLKRQFEELRKTLRENVIASGSEAIPDGIASSPSAPRNDSDTRDLSEEEADKALVEYAKGFGIEIAYEQLQGYRRQIRESEEGLEGIEIFFSIPETGTELFWVGDNYAGGHFNRAGTRIHISLPIIIKRGTDTGVAMAKHELKHIKHKMHRYDKGIRLVKQIASEEVQNKIDRTDVVSGFIENHSIFTSDQVAGHEQIEDGNLFKIVHKGLTYYILCSGHGTSAAQTLTKQVLDGIGKGQENDWLLIVEADPIVQDQEVTDVYSFAKMRDVAIERAVVSIIDSRVTQEFVKRRLGKREELFMEYFARAFIKGESFINILEDILLLGNKITEREEILSVSEAMARYIASVISENNWEKLSDRMHQIHILSLAISNELTRKKIEEILKIYPRKRNIFLQLGLAHLPAVINGLQKTKMEPVSSENLKNAYQKLLGEFLHLMKDVRPNQAEELDPEGKYYRWRFVSEYPFLQELIVSYSNYVNEQLLKKCLPNINNMIDGNPELWQKMIKIGKLTPKKDRPYLFQYAFITTLKSIKDKVLFGEILDMVIEDNLPVPVQNIGYFFEYVIKAIVELTEQDRNRFLPVLQRTIREISGQEENFYYRKVPDAVRDAKHDIGKFFNILQEQKRQNGNISCGTICESGHEGSYNALDEQLKRQFEELRKILLSLSPAGRGRGEGDLSEEEADKALVEYAKRFGIEVTYEKLQEFRREIKAADEAFTKIQIFFSIPETGTALFWVGGDYAGGHFNRQGTRIHISLPIILKRGIKAGIAIARHELAHVNGKGHTEDKGMGLVRDIAKGAYPHSEEDLGLCVTGDTMLPLTAVTRNQKTVTRKISLKPIVDVKPGDYVLSLNEETQQIEPHRINDLLDMGIKPVYKLTTTSGRSIKTTANHPYLTRSGWVKVSGLLIGDEIGAPSGHVLPGDETQNKQLIKRPQELLCQPQLLPLFPLEFPRDKSYGFLHVIKNYHEMIKYILSTKKVKSYSQARRETDSSLKRDIAYFDRQYMEEYRDKASIANSSKTLLASSVINADKFSILDREYRIKSACINIGINSKQPIRSQKIQCNDRTWDIFITFVRKLYRTIKAHVKSLGYGILMPSSLALGCSVFAFSLKRAGVSPWYILPSATIIYSPASVSTSLCILCSNHLSVLNNFFPDIISSLYFQLNYTTHSRINQVEFKIPEIFSFLSSASVEAAEIGSDILWDPYGVDSSDILWDKITSIEYLGYEHVYDIEVEGTHNFIGNGIFAHNTYIKDQNVSCGTICESGHEGSYMALDEQLKRQFEAMREILRITEERDLTEEEADMALVEYAKISGIEVTYEHLQGFRRQIKEVDEALKKIQIFFSIPETGTELFWVGKDYAGGHFNRLGTRIHISLPIILKRGIKAGIAIAKHELAHIKKKRHAGDEGLKITNRVAEEQGVIEENIPLDTIERLAEILDCSKETSLRISLLLLSYFIETEKEFWDYAISTSIKDPNKGQVILHTYITEDRTFISIIGYNHSAVRFFFADGQLLIQEIAPSNRGNIPYENHEKLTHLADTIANNIMKIIRPGGITTEDLNTLFWAIPKGEWFLSTDGIARPFYNDEMYVILDRVNQRLLEAGFYPDEKVGWSNNLLDDFGSMSKTSGTGYRLSLEQRIEEHHPFFKAFSLEDDEFTVFLARDAISAYEFLNYLDIFNGNKPRSGLVYQPGLPHYFNMSNYRPDPNLEHVQKVTGRIFYETKEELRIPKQGGDDEKEFDKSLYRRFSRRFKEKLIQAIEDDEIVRREAEFIYRQLKNIGALGYRKIHIVDLHATGRTIYYVKSVLEYFAEKEGIRFERVDGFIGYGRGENVGLPKTSHRLPRAKVRFEDVFWPFYMDHRDYKKGTATFYTMKSRYFVLLHTYHSLRLFNEAVNYFRAQKGLSLKAKQKRVDMPLKKRKYRKGNDVLRLTKAEFLKGYRRRGYFRPGFFGKDREAIYKRLNDWFGEGNWELCHFINGELVPVRKALELYEDSYVEYFRNHPEQLDWLVKEAKDVYDNSITNINSGIDYDKQETPDHHFHDIAIRRAVMRLGRRFEGTRYIQIRGFLSPGYHLNPGLVPFHRPELILEPQLKGWWKPNSVEAFYQSNKVIVLKEDVNVSCGTICESGHEGSYMALDEQLKRQFDELKKILTTENTEVKGRDLTEEEADKALVEYAKRFGIEVTYAQLQEFRKEIKTADEAFTKIQIFFSIPETKTGLFWVGEDYAGGHFNRAGTRIHISLPIILERGIEAGISIAMHELQHIKNSIHLDDDRGSEVVRKIATIEKFKKMYGQEILRRIHGEERYRLFADKDRLDIDILRDVIYAREMRFCEHMLDHLVTILEKANGRLGRERIFVINTSMLYDVDETIGTTSIGGWHIRPSIPFLFRFLRDNFNIKIGIVSSRGKEHLDKQLQPGYEGPGTMAEISSFVYPACVYSLSDIQRDSLHGKSNTIFPGFKIFDPKAGLRELGWDEEMIDRFERVTGPALFKELKRDLFAWMYDNLDDPEQKRRLEEEVEGTFRDILIRPDAIGSMLDAARNLYNRFFSPGNKKTDDKRKEILSKLGELGMNLSDLETLAKICGEYFNLLDKQSAENRRVIAEFRKRISDILGFKEDEVGGFVINAVYRLAAAKDLLDKGVSEVSVTIDNVYDVAEGLYELFIGIRRGPNGEDGFTLFGLEKYRDRLFIFSTGKHGIYHSHDVRETILKHKQKMITKRFIDNTKGIPTKTSRKIILALDTDIGNMTQFEIGKLLRQIKEVSSLLGDIEFVAGAGDTLTGLIEDTKSRIKTHNIDVIVVTKKKKEDFDSSYHVVRTDDSRLDSDSYVPILELLTFALLINLEDNDILLGEIYKEITDNELTSELKEQIKNSTFAIPLPTTGRIPPDFYNTSIEILQSA